MFKIKRDMLKYFYSKLNSMVVYAYKTKQKYLQLFKLY